MIFWILCGPRHFIGRNNQPDIASMSCVYAAEQHKSRRRE